MSRRIRPPWRAHLLSLLALSLLVEGCVAPPVPGTELAAFDDVETVELPSLRSNSALRRAQEITVRVRSLGCDRFGVGSGFVLPGGLVVTNRHVLVQPVEVSVNTWDGVRRSASVEGVALDSDLAILRLTDARGLPVAELRTDPVRTGEPIHAVGYPAGGPVTVTSGAVVGRVDGSLFGEPADVIRIDARVREGNSGGPLLDAEGRVVGVVFAWEARRDTGLAVPVDTLLERLDRTGLAAPEPC